MICSLLNDALNIRLMMFTEPESIKIINKDTTVISKAKTTETNSAIRKGCFSWFSFSPLKTKKKKTEHNKSSKISLLKLSGLHNKRREYFLLPCGVFYFYIQLYKEIIKFYNFNYLLVRVKTW